MVGAEDREQCRGGDWIRTVTEEKAGHLRVYVNAVKIVTVLYAAVLQGVGDVKGQALSGWTAYKHWHHQVPLSGRRKASFGKWEREDAPSPTHTITTCWAHPHLGEIQLVFSLNQYSNNLQILI